MIKISRVNGDVVDFVTRMGGSVISGKDIIKSSSDHNEGGCSSFVCRSGERWTDKLVLGVGTGEKAFYVFDNELYAVVSPVSELDKEIFYLFKNFGVALVTDGVNCAIYSGIRDDKTIADDFIKYHSCYTNYWCVEYKHGY